MLNNYSKTCHVLVVGLFLHAFALLAAPAFATPVQNANELIRLLTKLAHEYVQNGDSPRASDNLVSTYQHKVDARVLELRILKPIDDDPFIDAYVRWRLSGFGIDFPVVSDLVFQNFLEQLPPYAETPVPTSSTVTQLRAPR